MTQSLAILRDCFDRETKREQPAPSVTGTEDMLLAEDESQKRSGSTSQKRSDKNSLPLTAGFFILFFLLGADFMMGQIVIQIVDDFRLHFTGTIATEGSCFGYTGHHRDPTFRLNVAYKVKGGASFDEDLNMGPAIIEPNMKIPCVIRYDPTHPTHVGTNWGFQRLLSRSILSTVPVLLFGVPTPFFIFMFLATLYGRLSRDGSKELRTS